MSYTIELRPAAIRDLRDLPQGILRRITGKIDSLADNPRPPGVEKLTGSENSYRVRVGDYRILYQILDNIVLVIVVKIRHRREAYRK
ncbi:MAG TPA: type II toxin-antitoxin system RelE/ParE family toxin [Bacteroidota bacterium]|nr:type II toxin-antitoxin system RelE/ParE family toxin [Bacteroidota bacterium]